MSDSICYLSATEAIRRFHEGSLSPVELMTAVIDRSEQVEPRINAFSHTFFEQALEEARASEERYSRGEPRGVLDGLPLAMKDEIDVAGQPNTEGSLIYRDRVSDEDAVLTARLRAEGAIFHARTTCPEFCSLWNTSSRLYGVTRNPWNLDITPGGSSGGSGASLAAGTCTLATGSDIGGSIRFPASMCGLVGFKPPWGRVPETYVPFNMEMYCANGPMARTVADTALMQNVISGPDSRDAASTLPRVELPLTWDGDLRGKRIAWTLDFGYLDVEPDIVRNTLAMVERLKDLGAEVEERNPNFPDGLEQAYNDHMDPLFYASMGKLLAEHRDELCDYNIFMIEQSTQRRRDDAAFYKASCIDAEMYSAFGDLMESYDAFICPTVLTSELAADFNPCRDQYRVNGVVQEFDLDISTCHIFNMMGRCPSLSVPSGLAHNGVPTGLLISAPAYRDAAVFEIGAALESTWDKPFRPSEEFLT